MGKELKVTGKQTFMGIEIPIIEGGFGEDSRVLTDKMIAEIHGIPAREVRRLIKDNIKRFKENIDCIDLKQPVGDAHTLELTQFGYSKQAITQAKNIYILSERGYSKLIKIMDTDLAWEVHDELIDSYFTLRKVVKQTLSEKDRAIIAIVNSKSDMEQALAIKHYDEVITKPLELEIDRYSRFLCEKTGCLTKSELATKLDCKPQTLAAKLKQANIYTKTSQISKTFLDTYPDKKIIVESQNTYRDNNGIEHIKNEWQWTHDGAKLVVDYLVRLNMVRFTDNAGFKLIAC